MPKTQYIEPNEEIAKSSVARGDVLSEFFEISDKAREGGMGDVFFCRDKRDNKFYVLKTFKERDDKEKSKILEDFRKEALLTFKMPRLPYVVFTRTLILDETKMYLVMDFVGKQPHSFDEPVQSETLTHVLRNTKVEYKQALVWGIEFCRGMQYLHKYGISVHKDIKPDNILIAPDNTIRIADFGLSASNKKGGTKGYFPPEYSQNQVLTEQSDIYSFGVVLYQLFNNTHVPTINKDKGLENALLKKCLATDPKKRYQSFTHLEKDLIKELKLRFPEYILSKPPKYSTTADEYFLKGLGVYLLRQYSKTFDRRENDHLNREAEKLFNKCIHLSPKHAAAHYYHSKLLEEIHGLVFPSLAEITWGDSAMNKATKQIKSDNKCAQENSAFYANLIELEKYREGKRYQDEFNISLQQVLKNFAKYSAKYPRDPYLHNNLGVFEAKAGHYRRAISQFTKAIRLLPNYAVAYANRASIYLLQQEEKKALKDCAKYTHLQESKKGFFPIGFFYGIYVWIFLSYCRQKKYKKAYAWYEQHLNSLEEISVRERQRLLHRVRFQVEYERLSHLPTNYNKGEILRRFRELWKLRREIQQEKFSLKSADLFDKQDKQSLKLANLGFSIKPNMRSIFYNRMCIEHPTAPILNEMGCHMANWFTYNDDSLKSKSRGAQGIPYFNKAIKIDKTYAPAYYNRARAYAECKEYEKAVNDYTMAIELDPRQVCASKPLSDRYMQNVYDIIAIDEGWKSTDYKDGMLERYLESSRVKSEKKFYSHYIGDHLILDVDIEPVKCEAPAMNKMNANAWLLSKARYYCYFGKYNKALSCIKKLEDFTPQINFLEGLCLYKLGRYQEALKHFNSPQSKGPGAWVESAANKALCYAKCGDNEKEKEFLNLALEYFFEGIELRGFEDGPALHIAYIKKDDKKMIQTVRGYFESYYKQCLEKNKLFSVWHLLLFDRNYIDNAYYQCAECYFAIKNYAAALEYYKKALHPNDIFPTVLIPNFEADIKSRIISCEKALKISRTKKS